MRRRASSRTSATLEFLEVLWRANHALERRSRRMLRDMGVTAPQRMLIRMIGQGRESSPSRLAALLHLDRGTLTAAIKRLERAGFARRVTDTADRRRVHVVLTARGQRLNVPSARTVEGAVRSVLASETRSSLGATRRVLTRLSDVLERATERGVGPNARR